MSAEEAAAVAAVLSERTCHVGDHVQLRPTGDSIYIVKTGRVRLESGNIAIGILGPSQLFGTSSLFGAADTAQRAVAIEEVILCEAPAGAFLRALAAHPSLAAKVAQLLARQLSDLHRSIQRAAEDPVEARLAALVLQLADVDGARRVRGLSRADLARLIGASRESVSRLIAQWERDGLVRARQRTVEVADEAGLRERLGGAAPSAT